MKKLLSVLVVASFLLTACGGGGSNVSNLTVNDFATKISDASVTLLDVRTSAEYSSGHIAGATNIDFESGHFERDLKSLIKSKSYAVYCRSGNRSGQATAIMAKDGFTSIFNLSGGIINWTASGQQLVVQ